MIGTVLQAKLTPYALWLAAIATAIAVFIVTGAVLHSRAETARREAAEVRVEAAEDEVVRARAELELQRHNAEISEQLVAADILRLREEASKVEQLREKIRHDRPPVTPTCSPVLDPFRDAVRGLRCIETGDCGGGDQAAGAAPARR